MNAYQPDFSERPRLRSHSRERHVAAAFVGIDAVHDEVGDQDRHKDRTARDQRRQKQRRRGYAQHEADDDIGDRGRDQDAGTGARRDQRAGVGARITRLDQTRDGHATHRSRTRRVRARDRREHAADQHRGRPEAALGKAGQRLGHVEKLSDSPVRTSTSPVRMNSGTAVSAKASMP